MRRTEDNQDRQLFEKSKLSLKKWLFIIHFLVKAVTSYRRRAPIRRVQPLIFISGLERSVL